jgi:glutamate/tyrosine decarboxylase-like PLP-dependent enzyme
VWDLAHNHSYVKLGLTVKTLPIKGIPAPQVFDDLESLRKNDVDWRNGRVFSLAYYAGAEAIAVAEDAYRRFSGENALSTDAFPSLRIMQSDVLSMVGPWLGADKDSAGFMTSGGTESILMVVKAARDQFAATNGVTHPNIVLPTSAHAAFEKACHYFSVESRRSDVGPDWRADIQAMERLIDSNTILLVASAPQYPQGVIDDVTSIASLAIKHGVNCHVDACMGGVTLAYLEKLGHAIRPWNLSVPGVTSISVDLHKYGYTSKGASVVMYRNKQLRSHQGFFTDNWLGGMYASSGVLGTKSGGAIASAWAVLCHLGDDGYTRLTNDARNATEQLANHIAGHEHLVLRGYPDSTLISFGAADPSALNVFALADELRTRGWYVDRQTPPDSLHCTVSAVHNNTMDAFIVDLDASVKTVLSTRLSGDVGAYGNLE